MMIYRCRWQVELLFKELKSDTNWRRFAAGQQAIMEGLVWARLLALNHPQVHRHAKYAVPFRCTNREKRRCLAVTPILEKLIIKSSMVGNNGSLEWP